MSLIVTSGAQLMCSFGMAPSVLNVLPASKVQCSNMPPACITDNQPMVNIMPFGMCTSMANPQVAAATAAALWSLNPNALCAGDSSPLGTGVSDRIGGRKTSSK